MRFHKLRYYYLGRKNHPEIMNAFPNKQAALDTLHGLWATRNISESAGVFFSYTWPPIQSADGTSMVLNGGGR
jgi:hypothetical protein